MRTLALLTLVSATSAFAATDADREKAFKADIAPILEKSCIGCHGKDKAKKPKGGFDATSLASIVKGGKENGAGITWGDAAKSSLYKSAELGISSPDDDLAMPPKKAKERHPLTKEQLEKVKAFIEANK
jgi:mono/diheme cytochrome c family protein